MRGSLSRWASKSSVCRRGESTPLRAKNSVLRWMASRTVIGTAYPKSAEFKGSNAGRGLGEQRRGDRVQRAPEDHQVKNPPRSRPRSSKDFEDDDEDEEEEEAT